VLSKAPITKSAHHEQSRGPFMQPDPDAALMLAKARMAEIHATAATERLARAGNRTAATADRPTLRPFEVVRRLAAMIVVLNRA
jgi:hypothetical protein